MLFPARSGGFSHECARYHAIILHDIFGFFIRFYDYLALVSISDARCGDAWVVRKRQMNDAAFVWRHGFKCDGLSAVFDALSHPLGQIAEGRIPALLIACYVNEQVHPFSDLLGANEADQELQGPKSLSSPSDEQSRIVAVDSDDGAVHFLAVGLLEGDGC